MNVKRGYNRIRYDSSRGIVNSTLKNDVIEIITLNFKKQT
jgi:hypothetical protein